MFFCFFSSDLYLKGTFCVCAFVQNKEVSNYIESFSHVLLYSYNVSKVNFICTLISMSSKPSMENPIE